MKVFRNLAILSILLAFVLSGVVLAKPVNKADAEKMVKGWLKTDPKPLNAKLGGQVAEIQVYNGDDGSPAYYIVYLNPSGFVIVSADDQVEPVVGFVSGEALYDPSPENPLGALVSRDLPGRVDAAKKGKAAAGDAIKAQNKWNKLKKDDLIAPMIGSVSDVRVAPLVQTKWGQDYVCNDTLLCYNYYTPNHWYCGCTATAMAQILRYMQYPVAGIGVHQYGSYSTRGGDGSGGPYNYGLMIYEPGCDATDAQRSQIGALCYDAGVAAYMDYGSGGSGAYIHDAKAAFLNTFQYTNAVIGGNESTNIGAGLNGMVNPNLDAGIPVEFGIYGPGHAVVCDGYGYQSSTLYHHVNMGWDGYDDAWYELPAIDGGFTMVDACIYNLFTSGSGEIISGRVTYSTGVGFPGATVTATGPDGLHTATTSSSGVYALPKVNHNATYSVSVSYTGCTFTPSSQNAVTGTSTDAAITSGNVWGVNFSTTCSPPSPPATPASISYPSNSDSRNYTVSWASSTGATSYQLQRSSNGGGSWSSDIYSGANTSYSEDIGNGSYRYRVKASNGGGSSGYRTGTYDCVVTLLEGYAPITNGGNGGTVVHVTNCNDTGTGSLRAALGGLSGSPTTIVFDVGGVICIGVELGIVKPFVTIDGSSAPSPGITITSAGAYRALSINTHDVILKHMRFRDFPGEGIQIFGDYNLVIDHCSVSWTGDGAIDVNGGTTNIIISRTLYSGFVEGDRCYGINASLHHNMWTWGNRRQPKIYIAGPNYDFRNNVVEYWTGSGTNIVSCSAGVNIINNYYGNPAPSEYCSLGFNVSGSSNIYTAGNYSACGDTINETGDRGTPVPEPSVTTLSAQDAYTNVLANVGAKPTDAIDQYYIDGGGTNPPSLASCGGSSSSTPPPPPTPAIAEWVRGDIHYHTTNSDGSETLATMVTTYRDSSGGHRFSCVADHDYISNANQYTTSSFLGVNGVESSGGPHVVGFGVNGSGGFSGGSTLQSAIDAIANAGGLPMVAHVRWSHDYASYDMATLLANMTNCSLMSVYNWYCEDLWGYGNSESYWDTLLTNSKTIYGYAEDDTHGLGRMGYTFNTVGVTTADANLVSIKSALQNGISYFGHSASKWGSGITVSDYTVSGYDAGNTISITTSGATNIKFIGDNGAVLQSTDASSATYTITGTETYVRVKATNSAGDITWMQPVAIGGAAPGPQPPAWITYPSSSLSGVYAVSWAVSGGATSYQLQRSSDGGSNWSSDIYSGANTTYTEHVSNGSYRYRVKATTGAGSSDYRTGTNDCVVTIAPIEGYAPITDGGDGGTIIHVTNLNDTGTGSLRAAVTAAGPQPTTIVFDIGGVICVASEIRISDPNVTIDGATAPSPGITVTGSGTGYPLMGVHTHDVIVKHMRFRNSSAEDFQVWGDNDLIFDHCSFTGSGDGGLDVNGGTHHIIVSRCLFGGDVQGSRSYGNSASWHHNLLTWNTRQQPYIVAQTGPYDFRNNVVEYWSNSGTCISGATAVNIISNYYGNAAPGGSCNSGFTMTSSTNVYTGGNYSACGQNINSMGNKPTPNTEPSVTTITDPNVLLANVFADVGAQPTDSIDQYYIDGGGTNPPAVGSCGSGGSGSPPPTGAILEWIGPNGTASPWTTAANWYNLDNGAHTVPTNVDTARLYNALIGYNFTDSNVTVSTTTAICLKLQMRYLVTKLTVLTGGKLTTTGSVEMYLGTSGQLDIQSGATMDACTKANTSTASFKLANDDVTTATDTVNIYGTLNIVSLTPANGTSDLQICNVSGGTGTGTINIYSTGVLNTEAYTIGSYGTGRIYISASGTMKVTGNVTTQVNADISAGKIAGAGGATLSVNYNSGENKTYVTASGGGSPPPVPASITYPTSSSTGQYTVSWASSTGATSYQLQRSSNGGSSWSSDIYSGANTSYNENIGNGSYRYRVKATNAYGSSAYRTGTYDCVVSIVPPWSETADYYVDGVTGLDTNPGTSSQPYKTISKAMGIATAGKKVLVWGGQTYTGALTFSKNGTSSSTITFKRDPSSTAATINGNGTINGTIYATTTQYNTVDGFTITNGRYGVYNNGAALGWVIKNCRITGNTYHGVYFRTGDNHTVFNDAIYGNGAGYDGVYAYSSSIGHTVTQCSIYHQSNGIRTSTSATITTVRDCIVANCTTSGIYNGGSGISPITYCDVWSNGTNYYNCSAGTGCISANPLWVNPASGDFHLQGGSPCDNTGSDGGDMGYRYSTSAL